MEKCPLLELVAKEVLTPSGSVDLHDGMTAQEFPPPFRTNLLHPQQPFHEIDKSH